MTFLLGMTVTVGQNLHDLLGKCVHTLNPAATSAIDSQIEWKAMCMEGWSVGRWEEGCMWQGGGVFWGLLGGRLPTLCAPNPGESAGHCGSLLVHQPESWERDFSSAEPMTSRFFQNRPLWVSRFALLSSLSFSPLCSGCSAQSAPASYSIVIWEWPRLVILSWGLI